MVISRPTNILSVANQQISHAKLYQFIHQLKQLAIIICVLFIQYKMPSLPQAAFAVCKMREQNSRRPSKSQDGAGATPIVYNQKQLEYLPVKYNEKFMNAIWGHYNRYSPHNIKSNDAAIAISTSGKELMAAAATAVSASIKQQSFV
ncbi:uncharacterized protein LOC129576648 [Sitodiplosis mosellana]|uniref:uncharacterized protein LOC129576648 n=1 Tax=Sitodiplosis mosellana TaxID=263140 RepID=UPI002444FEA0|nr:uncharacterized protein LOC129576648 [Sitodiplosis mosellana]